MAFSAPTERTQKGSTPEEKLLTLDRMIRSQELVTKEAFEKAVSEHVLNLKEVVNTYINGGGTLLLVE